MTTSTWNVSASGDWSDASDWSGGVPNSSTATATIAEAGIYTVDVAASETFSVGSVTLNDANAILEIDGTLNLANTLTLTAGRLFLWGSLNGGTVNTAGGAFTTEGGTLNGVTVDGAITIGTISPATIMGGLTMAGVNGTGTGTITVDYSTLNLYGTQTVSNATIDVSYVSAINIEGGGTTTFASNTTIDQDGAWAQFTLGMSEGGSVVNKGAIDDSAGQFTINPATFTNSGSIAASNSATLVFDDTSFTNSGTISVDGTSTIDFDFAVTAAQIGAVNLASGAILEFGGMLNNLGETYVTPTGVELEGTIDGGTIEGPINMYGDLTLVGNPTLEGSGGKGASTINIDGGALILSGTEKLSSLTINFDGGSGIIESVGGGTLTLSSSVTINQPASPYAVEFLGDGGSGTIVNVGKINAGSTVQSGTTSQFTIDSASFTNIGTITVANGDTLNLDAPSFSNTGTISVDGTSTINFNFAATASQLGTINASSGATLIFSGGLNNSGTTYNMPAGVLLAGTINGGTIDGTIDVASSGGPSSNPIRLTLTGNPTVNGAGGTGAGTIDVTQESGVLILSGTETLDNATINLGFDYYDGSAIVTTGGTVTLGSSTTIDVSGTGRYAYLGSDALIENFGIGSGTLVNDGTINSESSGGRTYISAPTFTNSGTIAITNTDAVYVTPPDVYNPYAVNFSNAGTITVAGGSSLIFQSLASFDNTGTISVDGTSAIMFEFAITAAQLGTVNLATSATLEFQQLENSGATYVVPTGVVLTGTIDGGTLEGTINLTNTGAELNLSGVTMLGAGGTGPGTIDIAGQSSELNVLASGSLSNATINIGSSDSYNCANIDVDGTLASNVTVVQSAAGTYASISGIGINDGTIDAASKGGTFTLQDAAFTNAGTITVTNGDTFAVGNVYGYPELTNTGVISIDGTSELAYAGPVVTTQLGSIETSNGAVVDFSGTLNNEGATFVAPTGANIGGVIEGGMIEGTLAIASNTPLTPSSGVDLELTDSPTFEGAGGIGPGTIVFNGLLALTGTETISNFASENAGLIQVDGDSVITLASNVTLTNISIEIQPYLAVPEQGSVVDDGSITANMNGSTLTIEIPDFTNAGTITVTNGGTLYLEAVTGTPTTFINTGTITADGTSTLEFDTGAMTTAQMGTVNAEPGATIQFYGTLNNTGATYVAPTGTFIEGTIEGGTLEGNFNVTGVNALQLSGTMTVANATIDIGASGAGGEAIVNVGGGVVTIASTTTIEQTFPDTAAFLGTDANNSQFPISDGTVVNDGTIVSSVSGSAFGVDPDVFTNNGLLEATNGGEIAAGSNSFTNLSNTTLTGGSYEAAAGGKFEFVAFTTFVTDDATLILSGSSAIMEQLNLNTNIVSTIESTLASTGSGGTLEILGGRNWTQTTAFTNAGTIQLGGGTFQVSSLTGSGTIDGFGTVGVSASSAGALVALGGTLNVSDGSLSGYSGGTLSTVTLGAGANATLQLPGGVSISTLNGTIELLGAGAAIESSSVTVQSTLKTIGASGVLVVGDSYSSSNAISNTGTIRMAGGTLSTGTLTDSAGSNLSGYGTVASVYNDSGSVTSSGGALVFTGTGDTFAGVLGGQEIDFGGGTDAVQSGTNLTVATLGVYGNASVTFAANESYAGILKLGVGTMSFGANALILSGTGSTIAGTISSTATLTFSGGSQAINSGAALSMSSWTLSGNDATTVNTSLSYGGTFLAGAGTTLSITAGDTLTLTANSSFAGTITGAGTLALSGGADTIAAGTQLTVGKLALSSGAKVTVSGSLTDSGTISQASGTSLLLGANTLTLSGAGSVLDGAVTGTGTLALSGGSDTLGTGVALGVSNWSLASGATATLGTTFTYAGDLNEGAGTTLALGNDTLTLSASSTIAGSITGGGRLALSGGTQTFDSSAVLSIAKWSTSGTDVISIGGSVSFAEAFALGTGTSIAIGTDDSFSIAGSSTFAGKISGAGTLSFTGGTQALDGGTTLTAASWTISGSATASIKEALGYGGSFTAGAGSTVAIVLENSLTLSGTSTFSGTVNGAGSLILSGGAATLDAGANLAATKMTIHNGAAVTVAGSASIASNLTDAAGDSIAVDTGAALTLSGTGSTFASAITGGGTLALVGGTDALNTGVSLGVADWSLASAAKATFNVALNYAGILTEAAGTELSLTDGLTLSGAGSTLAGQIAGNGALTLSSGSQTFNSGAALTMAKWLIFSHEVVTIDESLTYAKAFSQASGTTLTLGAGDTLSLSGTSIVDGTVNGTGTLQVANATVSGLVVGGTVTLNDTGTIVQSGQMTLGDASSNAAALTIAAAGTYEIDGNAGIGIGASASSVIEDSGLLIKNAGTGVSTIDGTIADSGHIEAARGTLDLAQAITGSGAMQVDAGATLEFGSSAASTLTMTFNGANGTLALASPSTFAATIAGFAAGDDIDLVKMKATAAVLEGNDQLLITNNAHTVATLQLTGTYTGYTFNTISDGHGGIDITATAPGSHAASSAGNDAATVIAELTQNPSHAGIAEWHLG